MLDTKHETKLTLITNNKNMLNSQHKLYQLLTICLLSASTSAFAATGSEDDATAYVDSVNGWGAWELGLEPAAGGTTPSPSRALAARGANVQFRPNDNNAFSPNSKAVVITNTRPTPMPSPIPSAGPAAPGAPPPTAGPGDGF
jgi:hypothetical protein